MGASCPIVPPVCTYVCMYVYIHIYIYTRGTVGAEAPTEQPSATATATAPTEQPSAPGFGTVGTEAHTDQLSATSNVALKPAATSKFALKPKKFERKLQLFRLRPRKTAPVQQKITICCRNCNFSASAHRKSNENYNFAASATDLFIYFF